MRATCGVVIALGTFACSKAPPAPSEHDIRVALAPLHLHDYLGARDVFEIPDGKCSIDAIAVGAEADPYIESKNSFIVVNPSRNAIVQVATPSYRLVGSAGRLRRAASQQSAPRCVGSREGLLAGAMSHSVDASALARRVL